MKRVADASAESLGDAVSEITEPGAEVKTDGWRGYNELRSLGYHHQVIRKTADVGENLLPLCHREAALRVVDDNQARWKPIWAVLVKA